MRESHSRTALLAVMVLALAAFVPLMAESGDAAGEPDLSIYRYTPKLTMTSENFGAVKYIVWDFGDGTVLDGRWEYYIEKQDNGETLSADIIAGISAYKALLAQNGNSLIVTTHTYAQKGTYTATAVAMNPLGYVPEGGTAYDGILNTDYTGYIGGMDDPASKDIKAPTDAAIETSEFKASAGSWCRVNYTVEVKGYPTISFDTKGGSAIDPIEVQNTSEYSAATMPADPTKEGSTFNGWFMDPSCTQPYDWSLKVTQPMMLYAGWASSGEEQYDHIITFRDGSAVLGTQNTRNGTNGSVSVQITQDDPSRENKEFLGWVANTGDAPIHKGGTVSVPVFGLTLNASWGEADTTVTVYVDGQPRSFTSGQKVSDVVKPVQSGYTFDGWYSESDLRNRVSETTVLTEGLHLYSKMTRNTEPSTGIIVKVDGKNVRFDPGKKVSDIEKPTKEGFEFEGWYSDADLKNKLEDAAVLTDGMTVYSKMVETGENDGDDLIPYIIIVIGFVIAIVGLFVHPVMLIIGIAVAAFGGLEILDIIDLFR